MKVSRRAWVLLLCLPLAAHAAARRFRIEETFTFAPETSAHERRAFVPLPSDDPWQTITQLELDAPFEWVHDARFGNAAARIDVPASGLTLHVSFQVERRERAADLAAATVDGAPSSYAAWLADEAHVRVDARIRGIAEAQTQGLKTPLEKARALYAYVLKNMRYDKTGEGWGRGDIGWACDMKYGNCTDFHALMSGLLRACGIPARFHIGYSVPAGAAGEIAGYHCWMDFYVSGSGWVPLDASEAWKHADKRDYFFGHHDADRVELSAGRDLTFPGMSGAALNYLVFPYVEADGKQAPLPGKKVHFTPLP